MEAFWPQAAATRLCASGGCLTCSCCRAGEIMAAVAGPQYLTTSDTCLVCGWFASGARLLLALQMQGYMSLAALQLLSKC